MKINAAKKLTGLGLSLGLVALGACQDPTAEAKERQEETRADSVEEQAKQQAEAIRNNADQQAKQLDQQAEGKVKVEYEKKKRKIKGQKKQTNKERFFLLEHHTKKPSPPCKTR